MDVTNNTDFKIHIRRIMRLCNKIKWIFPKEKMEREPLNTIYWPQECLNLSRPEIQVPKGTLSLFHERMCTLIPQRLETYG